MRSVGAGLKAHGLSLALAVFAGLVAALAAGEASCGAWLMPPGEGQIIAGLAFSGSTRAFNKNGRLIPVPSYQKFELGGYLEYGLCDWATLVAAPAIDRTRQSAPGRVSYGPGDSAAGARVRLYEGSGLVLSGQAMLVAPGASFNGPVEPKRAGSIDLRGLAGYGFSLAGTPAFASAEAGYRFYARGQPGAARFDFAFGFRPVARLLVLAQSFMSLQTRSAVNFPRSLWQKAQLSLVYEFAPGWSAQLGGFMTLWGINTGRELGPLVALWRRF